ncbi:enoyl-CoA hydratase [Paractinoplanes abujensis]|uniref:Enoyl-CoA hydratase/carnithine racemase n=1 Tax=Paractinoplanes abujensis TaxID=882441 RepID=A0A7W7CSM3_9ACTN|nr:enoyl-CoA hydratase-related protein [Actinoplanes abujensis]MBB4693943.1 enoyl-CoA hydratase/carnithine racemase [Actinoplanes abujensis]GID21401.1 enoyl-CoA hydratase [Actinoplanes abujensis]
MAAEIISEVRDGVGWVTMSNPARRNALSTAMLTSLTTVVREYDTAVPVRSIVLRGAGDTFTAGADISEFAAHHDSTGARETWEQALTGLFESLSGLTTPLIAMIQGPCFGAGMALALSADIRIAAEGSTFGIPAARLGIGYPYELAQTLVHVIGPAHASDMLFTARSYAGSEALAAGLINRLVPAAALEADVLRTASAIAANAPLAVRAAKASIKAAAHPPLAARAQQLIAATTGSHDEFEGQRAFMERRPPSFEGR